MARIDGVPILVTNGGSSAVLERVPLGPKGMGVFDEAWLQCLIHNHPNSLPLAEIEPGFAHPVAICMEFPTKHGPVDNLLITGDGDIVIVETKLWRNVEARRQVVAQALDYASCLFEMDYGDLEAAALRGNFGKRTKPGSLYNALPEEDVLAEPDFIDAISLNLRNGRIVVLVVGDGIRSEVERLSAALQSHAGFHFTFALVEMAAFHLPDKSGIFVQPRTLIKTQMIERGIVRIDDQRAKVTLAVPSDRMPAGITQNITAEQFFDAMAVRRKDVPEKLKAFLTNLERIGVYPEFRKSLNIKWDAPNGKSVNLGYIKRDGLVWTDAVNAFAPIELAHRYNENLAAALGVEVEKLILAPNWHIRHSGKVPRIENIVDRLDAWVKVIEQFIAAVQRESNHDNTA